MAVNIITSKTRVNSDKKPPLGSQIDWSHPLSRGLVFCALMNENGGNIVIDTARKNNGTTVNAFYVSQGIRFNTTFANSRINILPFIGGGSEISYYFSIFPINFGEGGSARILSGGISGAERYTIQMVGENAGQTACDLTISIWRNGSITESAVSNNAPLIYNQWNQVVFRARAGSNINLYVNNKEVSYTTQDFVNDYLLPFNQLYIGDNSSGSRTTNCILGYFYIFNKFLSPSEIQQLYIEPYCFIAPVRRRFYLIPSATPPSTEVPYGYLTTNSGYW